MPYTKDQDLAKQRKHEWYVKNKDEIFQRKRERRAAKKKQQPPLPKPPPPTPEQIPRARELNRQACNKYRATHLRDRRATKKNPFRKLRALADVCSERLNLLNHGPAHEKREKNNVEHRRQYRKRKRAAVDGMEEVRARNRQRYYERINHLNANGEYEPFKKFKATQGKQRYHNKSVEQREKVKRKKPYFTKGMEGTNDPRGDI